MQLSSDYAAQILQQPHLAARNIDPTQLLKNQVREQKACVIVEQLAVGAAVGSQKGRDSYRCSERESYQLPSCLIQLFICWWTLVSSGQKRDWVIVALPVVNAVVGRRVLSCAVVKLCAAKEFLLV